MMGAAEYKRWVQRRQKMGAAGFNRWTWMGEERVEAAWRASAGVVL